MVSFLLQRKYFLDVVKVTDDILKIFLFFYFKVVVLVFCCCCSFVVVVFTGQTEINFAKSHT